LRLNSIRVFTGVRPSFITLVAAMGSHRVVLPEAKFSGEEDVREFLRDFEIYVTVNEWTDEKAGQYKRRRKSLLSPTVGGSEEKF